MIDHEERIGAALRAASADLRARPTLVAEVRVGALRRRRRHRVAGGTAAVAVAAVVASAVAAGGLRSVAGPENSSVTGEASASASRLSDAPAACQIDRLPVPAGHPRSLVTGGDPSGRYIVGRAYASRDFVNKHPLLIWDDGRLTSVDMPGDDERFTDINGAGVAVGAAFTGSDTQSAYVYRNGNLTRLLAPAGSVEARAIGENGLIAGTLGTGGPGDLRVPLVWRDPAAPAERVVLPAGMAEGEAVDVDTDGTVVIKASVANTRGPDGGDHAYVRNPDGTGRILPMPLVDGKPVSTFWPVTIHNGTIFGRAAVGHADGSVRFTPFRFDLRTDTWTRLTNDYGIVGNSRGWMVGNGGTNGPFVSAPAGRATLPVLVPGNAAGMDSGTYISADGLTVGGQAVDDTGQIQAVRWRCTKVV